MITRSAIFHAAHAITASNSGCRSSPEIAADAAAEAGFNRDGARAAIDDPAIKDALRRDVEAAIAAGVFGSPFVFVDGEPFWGVDRFDQVERWLAEGGF